MKIYHITQQQLDKTPQHDHKRRWPGVIEPGAYTWNETAHRYEPVSSGDKHPHDFDRTGLGIGGLSRHNPQDEILELVARGEMHVVEHERRGSMPHGQLWEPCPSCGDEPVCLDCGLCGRHCNC